MGSNPKSKKAKKKSPTANERSERIKAAQAREERAQQQRDLAARNKKIFTIVICVILILAMCIPTMALTVLSSR